MWFDNKQAVQEAYKFIKFLLRKKSITDHRIDTEALIQETLLKVIKATKQEASNEIEPDKDTQKLNAQTDFNHVLKAYTYKAFESVYLDMGSNVTYRRKSASEQAKSPDEGRSVQIVHLYESNNSSDGSNNIYELMPSDQPSPDQVAKMDRNARLFINLLLETIAQEEDKQKQALFYDFFTLSFRQNALTQKQLGERHGFKGNAAITYISRFVNKLSKRVEESGLSLEIGNNPQTDFDIYFLTHSNKLNETISV
ncbi:MULTISPECIES: hypothetical protein [Pseudoalteromonas]|uniref:Uncharacterized protein n=1 Tax=Pseudoalteromonas luteoviolacea (strain 2ta16) TaxID=1353533 RepID=V4J7C9_PSEL2|nr:MULTISPECIES: hypothetical protein [Pseudoalteromonas]ESP91192.1 hypothetical protein PL2TA16_01063 [Pseudoalteromonas luteoviolacea 2ta16]KZN31396.1 hypothetical protein N483_06160 [Pseudoalteromonas luteoviolacea NCIMB 1944]MCG7548644.1 hypothetical protein [Pseudoalteromonas sp. Of7M-16]